jgi:hypothetical protein
VSVRRGQVLFAALAVVLGGAAAVYLYKRFADGSDAASDVEPQDGADVMSSGRHVGQVFHRERADALDDRLQTALDTYAENGPYPLVVVDGLRAGAAAEAAQAQYFSDGRSHAATLDQTPHGRGGAFDFAVVDSSSGDAVIRTLPAEANAEAYKSVGEYFEALGLTWGGRWGGFGAHGDAVHIEVPDWRDLPFPPGG